MSNSWLKAKYSAISALVFFIVANPEFYKFTQALFGGITHIVQPMGLPACVGAATPAGLILHTVLFFFAMWGLMMIPLNA
jgi:hypothetical protein